MKFHLRIMDSVTSGTAREMIKDKNTEQFRGNADKCQSYLTSDVGMYCRWRHASKPLKTSFHPRSYRTPLRPSGIWVE